MNDLRVLQFFAGTLSAATVADAETRCRNLSPDSVAQTRKFGAHINRAKQFYWNAVYYERMND